MAASQESLEAWEARFEAKVRASGLGDDPAHDIGHIRRVVASARRLALPEEADLAVVLPAAWLHDLVNVPKNDPRRSSASRLSAEAAIDWLRSVGYEQAPLDHIAHAIEAHSYSANIECRTVEARVVQDADRLDAIGAIGIARTFAVAGQLGTSIHDIDDPFARDRDLDDRSFAVDHFHVKLFGVARTMKTQAGREEALRRAEFLRLYLAQLGREIGAEPRQI
jgi:uncharacterized protein